MPVLDGAATIYKKIIRPLFFDVKGDIDESWAKGTAKGKKCVFSNITENL